MKILFVCLGNICRSPMAEMIMKELVREKGLEDYFVISSAGISSEEEGNDIYLPVKRLLIEKNIPFSSRKARKIKENDVRYYDYVVVMEKYQQEKILKNYQIEDSSKVRCLNSKDVEDPWYSGNYERVYEEILEGCKALLEELCTQVCA